MYFLFSGEGPTDCGVGLSPAKISEGTDFLCGPMVLLVDQLVNQAQGYSPRDAECLGLLRKQDLNKRSKTLKPIRLPGYKHEKETGYFAKIAHAMALEAQEKAGLRDDDVVAVLFRDCDGSHSTRRGLWERKVEAMEAGFSSASFSRGVPMIPSPISEAWLICALKKSPYANCDDLEKRTGNPNAEHPFKQELEKILGKRPTRVALCLEIEDGRVSATRIDMKSYNGFKASLLDAIK